MGLWSPGVPVIKLNFGTLSPKPENYRQWRLNARNDILGVDYIDGETLLRYVESMDTAPEEASSDPRSTREFTRLDLKV